VAFAGGPAWAAFSGSVGVLIAARASMERQRAIGFWAGTSGVGFALGPIVGGLLLAHFWWGSVFLINVPIAAAGLLCAIPLVPDSKNPAALRPDFTGAVLSIAGLALVLWSIIEAPTRGWMSPLVIGAGLGGLVVLGAFAAWERASSHPMLNLRFFRSRSFSGAISSVSLVMFALAGSLFLRPSSCSSSWAIRPCRLGCGCCR
jgi:MFS family permease